MTDGIYDPKFNTENKLENPESWKTFFDDLQETMMMLRK
jgi:hypothetical protein